MLGAAGVLIISLGGCASKGDVPDPGTSPSPAAEEPAPTDPPAVAASILVRSDGLQVVDLDGNVLESVTYFDPIDQVVSVLSAATGSSRGRARHPSMRTPRGR